MKVTCNRTCDEFLSIYKQINPNDASVPRTLGGAHHGHLRLVTNAITYARIVPGNPFVLPVQPSTLRDNNTVTDAKIAENLRSHNLSITHFHQANHVERTIINQLQKSLDEPVLMPKINEDTGVLEVTIVDLMTYLFGAYGDISDQKLHEVGIKTTEHKYIHSDPVENVFNIIQKYATSTETHGNLEAEKKLIIIGTIIIINASIFADAVEKWNLTPAAKKTLEAFQIAFHHCTDQLQKISSDLDHQIPRIHQP